MEKNHKHVMILLYNIWLILRIHTQGDKNKNTDKSIPERFGTIEFNQDSRVEWRAAQQAPQSPGLE